MKLYNDSEILDAYQETPDLDQIAERLGMKRSAVYQVLYRFGIRFGGSGCRIERKHDYDLVLKMFQELDNQHEVARRLGIAPAIVSQILIRMGVRLGRGRRNPTHKLPMDEVIARYNAGESTIDLAASYGVDPEVIRKSMKRKGADRRDLVDSRARGEKNAQWKGGKSQSDPVHYFRRQSYEVAAICTGQPLPLGCVIHHLDENPENNNPENLVLFASQKDHARFHQLQLCLQRAGRTVDANQLALENGAWSLPQPPAPLEFLPDTSPLHPYKKHGSPLPGQLGFALDQE